MTTRVLAASLALVLASCGGAEDFVADDASEDTGIDTGTDTAVDTGTDTAVDTGTDTETDTGPDAPPGECGNGTREPGEECDDGNDEPGDGCENDCTWTCERNWECADEDFCTSDVCNPSTHVCEHASIDCSDTDDCTVDGCDPSSGCTHEPLPRWYRDEDLDGYGRSTDWVCANVPPEGRVAAGGDCCDTLDDVNPGVTAWFTTYYYCGSTYGGYDYDCNGTAEQRWTARGGCSMSGGSCTATVGWDTTGWIPTCGYVSNWIVTCTMDTSGGCVPGEVVERRQECR
jgi:cysteine-rich repeat protein